MVPTYVACTRMVFKYLETTHWLSNMMVLDLFWKKSPTCPLLFVLHIEKPVALLTQKARCVGPWGMKNKGVLRFGALGVFGVLGEVGTLGVLEILGGVLGVPARLGLLRIPGVLGVFRSTPATWKPFRGSHLRQNPNEGRKTDIPYDFSMISVRKRWWDCGQPKGSVKNEDGFASAFRTHRCF